MSLFSYKPKQLNKSAIEQNNHEVMFFVTEKHNLFLVVYFTEKRKD